MRRGALSVTHLSILGEEVVCVEVDCAEVANLIKLEYQLDESGAQGVVAPSKPTRACKNKYTPPHMTLDMPHTQLLNDHRGAHQLYGFETMYCRRDKSLPPSAAR
jgi:hypothetical protein